MSEVPLYTRVVMAAGLPTVGSYEQPGTKARKMLALFWARKYASSILRGGKRYEAIFFLNTQNPVGLRFLIF